MIRETLAHIASQYLKAKTEPFAGHPLANYLRHNAPDAISEALSNSNYVCKGSAGQSDWADVPWIGVYNPSVTTTATQGYYVAYLFNADMQQVHLTLAQGTTKVRQEFGKQTTDALLRFSGVMRDRLPEAKSRFRPGPIQLLGASTLARDYEPSVALCASYFVAQLPAKDVLRADLIDMARFYSLVFARGGRDNLADSESDDEEEADGESDVIVEKRRYQQHRKIERNPKAGKLAKRAHGYKCQCCGFDFEGVFGSAGAKYIEAHHLTPLSDLPEDVPISLDPVKDFAVLCANCHRMIHRKDAPKSVFELKALAGVQKLAKYFATISD